MRNIVTLLLTITTVAIGKNADYQTPLYVTRTRVFLQSDRTYQLPCTTVQPGDRVAVVFWFRGESSDATQRELLLRATYPDDGANFALDPRYKLSTSQSLIIESVSLNDSDRYWCKTALVSAGRFTEDSVDVTVLGKELSHPTETLRYI